ncbi:hypothetical protein KOI35_46400 [Actinoplanes bogorensis]|uniref:Uncharacterized protein n=1 Tax=Paractinoplanes bogorensis TaxID=1610840 RepID=A0ABS5Z7N8_9ACTN|nr:hypothetical protein [Actinoplanes bogorensis]MBU2670954.1 hypothetical protein [Actinoplanes bogorensis]
MAGSAREEAERLVAAVLARAVTGQAFNDRRWATGDPECCVCPVCKAIAAMRDPRPETAAKLAGSASDLAGSVASLLRGVSAIVGEKPKPARPAPVTIQPGNADQTWSAVTRADANTADSAWAAATNAVEAGAPDGSDDPWAAATTASASAVAEAHAAELAERRAAALAAAAEAERRVAEAAALAKARREAAAAEIAARATGDAGSGGPGGIGSGAGGSGGGETGDTAGRVAAGGGAPRRFDVWAAATADAGVRSVAHGATVDHDVAGAGVPDGTGDDESGDDARAGGAEQADT